MLGHYDSKAVVSFASSFESWKYFAKKRRSKTQHHQALTTLKYPEILVLQLEKQMRPQ